MPKKNDKIDVLKLTPYELFVYMIMKKHKDDGEISTLEHIHFDSIKYATKQPVDIKPNETLVKVLKKIATENKTTLGWELKPEAPFSFKNPLDKNPR